MSCSLRRGRSDEEAVVEIFDAEERNIDNEGGQTHQFGTRYNYCRFCRHFRARRQRRRFRHHLSAGYRCVRVPRDGQCQGQLCAVHRLELSRYCHSLSDDCGTGQEVRRCQSLCWSGGKWRCGACGITRAIHTTAKLYCNSGNRLQVLYERGRWQRRDDLGCGIYKGSIVGRLAQI